MLRDYQQAAVDEVRRREQTDRIRVALQAPTGAGKTRIMAALLRDPCPQLVLTHRRVLLDQLSEVLTKCGVPHGFRAAGREPNEKAYIQLAMVQTEHARSFRAQRVPMHNAERVHVDEIHVQKARSAQEILRAYNRRGASTIGYTATPIGLGSVVDDVIVVATVPQLVERGYLCPPKVFSCGQPDREALARLRRDASGEYLASDVNRIMRPPLIFGDVWKNYMRLNPDGRPFILYAHSVKASRWWAASLSAKGVPTAHISGEDIWVDGRSHESTEEKRRECFDRIEAGELRGLSNRFVLREGVDLPILGHAILTCPIGSRASLVQSCGRVLRPYGDREYAIIQDHSGSFIDHPALDSAAPWDWRKAPGIAERIHLAAMRDEEIPEPIVCPECKFTRYTGDTCPNCGHRYHKYARYVYQVNGDLRLMHGRSHRPRPVVRRATDEQEWLKTFHANRRYKPKRTFEQIYTYFAYKNRWRWLPRDLKYMPRDAASWFLPCGSVPLSDLRQESAECLSTR